MEDFFLSKYRWILIPVTIYLVFWAGPVLGGSAGEATGQVLEMGGGAVLPAMGGAGQASVAGPAAIEYNPAGLAGGEHREVELSYMPLVEGINYGNFGFIWPGEETLTWAAGGRILDYGTIDETEAERHGDDYLIKQVGDFQDVDVVLTGALGGRVFEEWQWGVAPRVVRLEAYEDAIGPSLDVGVQWHPDREELPLSLGFVTQNIGPGLKFDEVNEDLPLLFRGGFSVYLSQLVDADIVLHGDFEHHMRDVENFYRIGAQWNVYDLFNLRMGYDNSHEIDDQKLTYGFGYSTSDGGISFNYALVPHGEFDHVHRFGLSFALPEFQPSPEVDEVPEERYTPREPVEEPEEPEEPDIEEPRRDRIEEEEVELPEELEVELPEEPEVEPGELPELDIEPPELILEELDVEKRLARGRVAFVRGDFKEALENFVQVHEVWPQNHQVLLWMGITEMEMGNPENAWIIFEQVLELDPGNEAALVNMHRLVRDTGS